MTDAIDKACLLSIPFFLYFAATRKAQLFAPQHRMVQLCLIGILIANLAVAISNKLEFPLTVFDVPLMQIGSIALLCFFWLRGVYLVITGHRQEIAPGP